MALGDPKGVGEDRSYSPDPAHIASVVVGSEAASEVGTGIAIQNMATTTTTPTESEVLTGSRIHFGPYVDPDLVVGVSVSL